MMNDEAERRIAIGSVGVRAQAKPGLNWGSLSFPDQEKTSFNWPNTGKREYLLIDI